MKLDDWLGQIRSRIDAFEFYWKQQHDEYPEDYPMDMLEGEWEDHVDAWMDNGQPDPCCERAGWPLRDGKCSS